MLVFIEIQLGKSNGLVEELEVVEEVGVVFEVELSVLRLEGTVLQERGLLRRRGEFVGEETLGEEDFEAAEVVFLEVLNKVAEEVVEREYIRPVVVQEGPVEAEPEEDFMRLPERSENLLFAQIINLFVLIEQFVELGFVELTAVNQVVHQNDHGDKISVQENRIVDVFWVQGQVQLTQDLEEVLDQESDAVLHVIRALHNSHTHILVRVLEEVHLGALVLLLNEFLDIGRIAQVVLALVHSAIEF